MSVETYDLLNQLVSDDRIRNITVSAYIINEVEVLSFLKDNVKIASNTKFVQVKTLAMKDRNSEVFLDAILYASVPKETPIGNFCFLQGSLAPISKESYSKECSLFKFRKEGVDWWLEPIKVINWVSNPFTNEVIKKNLSYWEKYPLTLSTGITSIVQPITRMFETEILFDLSVDLYEMQGEYLPPEVSLEGNKKLTSLQAQVLKEMLVYPVVQFRVEDEVFLTNTELAAILKEVAKDKVTILDLRNNSNNSLAVLRTLEKQGKFMDGKSYWILCDKFTEGIPSVLIGKECLI